jgi:hypothetical protein
MAKASFTLPNGTVVQIEGTTEEVRELLQHYAGGAAAAAPDSSKRSRVQKARKPPRNTSGDRAGEARDAPDLTSIVNMTKTCDEAEGIEHCILDSSSQVDRVLLPLYIVHEHLDNEFSLSSGDITKVTTDLGVPVSQPAVSRTLAGPAARYVIGDRVRKKGQLVRYRVSRRGVQYLKTLIAGAADADT